VFCVGDITCQFKLNLARGNRKQAAREAVADWGGRGTACAVLGVLQLSRSATGYWWEGLRLHPHTHREVAPPVMLIAAWLAVPYWR